MTRLIKNKRFLCFLITLVCLTLFISIVKADTIITEDDFDIDILDGDAFKYQDIANGITFTFTVTDGNLTGSGSLDTTDAGGTLVLTPTTTGIITVTATSTGYTLYLNGVSYIGGVIGFGAVSFTISWVYTTEAAPTLPETLNVKPFWQYLFSGNLLGFFQAIFLWGFILQDILVGIICALFMIPLYIRTKSLLLLAVIWILLGSFFIVAMPAISGLAILFLILGVASVLWKLIRPN